MAQRDHFKRGAHFRDFPDRAGIERRDPHAAPGKGDHEMLGFELTKSFSNRDMT